MIVKAARRAAIALIGPVATYLLAAVIGAWVPGPTALVKHAPTGDPVDIRLIAGPIHYDLLLPLTPETRAQFADLHRHGLPLEHPQAQWLVIGWGSRAFYTHEGPYSSVSAATIWRAVSGDDAVIRVDVAGVLDPDFDAPTLRLTTAQYTRLLQVIGSDFLREADGTAIALAAPGFTDTDVFFEAQDRFHILRTCNTWISRSMRRAGVPFGAWTPTPYSVTLSHRFFHGS